ncbi:FAD/NAD(P)-binding domain-containing protein [Thozetella sp. PMI_491]|nr:FAD/NAD(P)-binding domain-containing protein [Thozetella sp. PMI_491]
MSQHLGSKTGVQAVRKLRQGALVSSAKRQFSIRKRETRKERVVVLGSGWAGYAFARTLDPEKFDRIVVSPRSYFVFTPLLASTSVGTLEFRAVLEPVRRLKGVRFFQGWADDVDFSRKIVHVEANANDDLASRSSAVSPPGGGAAVVPKGEMFAVPYDKLVVAVGAYSQTFGTPGVKEHAHFLRDIGDARRIRLRVLSLFEQCSYPANGDGNGYTVGNAGSPGAPTAKPLTDDQKRSLLHFAIVGGGPTGIEFAAELHDLIHDDLAKIYPNLLPFVRITVYDVAPKVLPMFEASLARYAMDTFRRQGIEVKTEHHLERVSLADGNLGSEHGGLKIKVKESGNEEIGAGLVVWSTGLMQNPLVEKLVGKEVALANDGAPGHLLKDPKTGGILTDGHLRARVAANDNGEGESQALDDVFVIGDSAVIDQDKSLPKTAQVASQQAVFLAKSLNRGEVARKVFRFRNWGTLTYLGSWKAIHQSSADELKGWVAWVVWRGAYLTKSMSIRNKIMVPVYWAISWLFGRDINRF